MNCLTLKTRRWSKEAKRGEAIKHSNNRDWISFNHRNTDHVFCMSQLFLRLFMLPQHHCAVSCSLSLRLFRNLPILMAFVPDLLQSCQRDHQSYSPVHFCSPAHDSNFLVTRGKSIAQAQFHAERWRTEFRRTSDTETASGYKFAFYALRMN